MSDGEHFDKFRERIWSYIHSDYIRCPKSGFNQHIMDSKPQIWCHSTIKSVPWIRSQSVWFILLLPFIWSQFIWRMKSSTLKMCSQSIWWILMWFWSQFIGWILYRESGVKLYHKFFNLNLKLVHLHVTEACSSCLRNQTAVHSFNSYSYFCHWE